MSAATKQPLIQSTCVVIAVKCLQVTDCKISFGSRNVICFAHAIRAGMDSSPSNKIIEEVAGRTSTILVAAMLNNKIMQFLLPNSELPTEAIKSLNTTGMV